VDELTCLQKTPHRDDMICLDAYDADAMPSRLTTREFLRELEAKLPLTDHYAPVDGLRHFSTWSAGKYLRQGAVSPRRYRAGG
jgi:spermidine synthase